MRDLSLTSTYRAGTIIFMLLLSILSRSLAFQPRSQPPQQSAKSIQLTANEEKDSYEIYSMLLRTEMPPQWNITRWAIKQITQTFRNDGMANGFFGTCLDPPQNQRATYLPLIKDYVERNKTTVELGRKFDLPEYALVGRVVYQLTDPFKTSVIFHVSVVGFSPDRTRALVYVGHHCGSLCGSGGYHFMVKRDAQWQADKEYRGMTCFWEV